MRMQQSSIKFEVPENSQVYLSITNLHFSNDKQKKVDILVNGEKKTFTTIMPFSFFNLGYTKEKKTFNIHVSFPGNSQVSLNLLPSPFRYPNFN